MPRVGAVDIGTNSTRLLVADVDGSAVTALARRSKVTHLGEAVDSARRLSPAGVARVHAVLGRYREELDVLGAGRTLAVGTSAVRDAANGREFMHEVEATFGFETLVVSGEEEAELTRLGVGAVDDTTLLLDVGGGSTELITGRFRTSLDVGSVRLSERFLHDDPPTAEQRDEAAAFVDSLLPELEVTDCIAVGGTAAQLQALAGELTLASIEHELERLAALPLAERRQVPRLDPDRAPVIVTGALIVRQVLRRYRLDRLVYSERDLLDGIAITASR